MKFLSEYFKKLRYQSTIILAGLFIYSFFSLGQNTLLAISGGIAFVLAILLIIFLIFYFLIKENYDNIILHLNNIVKTTKNNYENIIKSQSSIYDAVKDRQDMVDRISTQEMEHKKDIQGTSFITRRPISTKGK